MEIAGAREPFPLKVISPAEVAEPPFKLLFNTILPFAAVAKDATVSFPLIVTFLPDAVTVISPPPVIV